MSEPSEHRHRPGGNSVRIVLPLVSDVKMPDLGGLELYRHTQQLVDKVAEALAG